MTPTIQSVRTCRKGHPLTPENLRTDGGCRTCKRAAARARYARDDRQREAVKAWRWANPDKVAEHRRRTMAKPEVRQNRLAWVRRNPEKMREYNRRAYEKHGEKVRERVRLRLEAERLRDPKAAYRRTRAWVEANPERARLTAHNSYVLRRGAPSIPFTDEQFLARMAFFGNCCWMCGGAFEQVDHVKPLARGGWHALMNLRPACRSCNASKNAAWPLPQRLAS